MIWKKGENMNRCPARSTSRCSAPGPITRCVGREKRENRAQYSLVSEVFTPRQSMLDRWLTFLNNPPLHFSCSLVPSPPPSSPPRSSTRVYIFAITVRFCGNFHGFSLRAVVFLLSGDNKNLFFKLISGPLAATPQSELPVLRLFVRSKES